MSWAEDMGYDGYDESDLEPALRGTWYTADGKCMSIKNMDNSHLVNAYNKLVRENKRYSAQEVLLREIGRRVKFARRVLEAEQTLMLLAGFTERKTDE